MSEPLCDYCNGPLGDKWTCIPRLPLGYTNEFPLPREGSQPDVHVNFRTDRYCRRCTPYVETDYEHGKRAAVADERED
jgi:hypothetical protein